MSLPTPCSVVLPCHYLATPYLSRSEKNTTNIHRASARVLLPLVLPIGLLLLCVFIDGFVRINRSLSLNLIVYTKLHVLLLNVCLLFVSLSILLNYCIVVDLSALIVLFPPSIFGWFGWISLVFVKPGCS